MSAFCHPRGDGWRKTNGTGCVFLVTPAAFRVRGRIRKSRRTGDNDLQDILPLEEAASSIEVSPRADRRCLISRLHVWISEMHRIVAFRTHDETILRIHKPWNRVNGNNGSRACNTDSLYSIHPDV